MTDGQGQPEGTGQGQGFPAPDPGMPAPQAPPPPPPAGAPQYAPPPPGAAPYGTPPAGAPQYAAPQPGGEPQQPPAPYPVQNPAMYQQPPAQGGWQPPPAAPVTPAKGGKKALIWVLVVLLVLVAAAAGTYFYGKSSADDAAKKYDTAYAKWKSGDGAAILDAATKGAPADAFPADKDDPTQAILDKQKTACDEVKATATSLGSAKAIPPALESNAFSSLSTNYDAAKKSDTERRKKFKDFTSATQKAYQQFSTDCEWLHTYGVKLLPLAPKVKAFDSVTKPTTPEELPAYIKAYEDAFVPLGRILVDTMASCPTTSLKPACAQYQAFAQATKDVTTKLGETIRSGGDPDQLTATADAADKALADSLPKAFPGIGEVSTDDDGPAKVETWIVKNYVESLAGQVTALKAL